MQSKECDLFENRDAKCGWLHGTAGVARLAGYTETEKAWSTEKHEL